MRKDQVTDRIVKEVQDAVNKRFNTSLTVKEIYEIIDWQFKEVVDAMDNMETSRVPFLGTFIPKDKKQKNSKEIINKPTNVKPKPKKQRFGGISLTSKDGI
jgi:nucleoid DNA-binding protein